MPNRVKAFLRAVGPSASFALAATLAFAFAVGVFRDATAPLHGRGLTRFVATGTTCLTDPTWTRRATQTVVPEPFIAQADIPEQCTTWRGSWVVTRPTRWEVEVESDDDGVVLLDGVVVVDDGGAHPRNTKSATRDVSPGVHALEVRNVNRGGGAYLRVRAQDRRDAYMAGVLPLDRDALFVRRADAEAAFAHPTPSRRVAARALAAALATMLALVLAWLALRCWRRRSLGLLERVPADDLAIALAVSAVALAVRAAALSATDLAWDELWYWNAGEHYVRNALLGDWSPEAFRFNMEHPPIAKWIFGLGGAIGGLDGARSVGCVLSAASVGLTYAVGRVLFERRVGLAAALVLAVLPHVVAHGRLVGLESVVTVFWCADLLALAVWLRSVEFGDHADARGDGLAAAMAAFLFFPGLLARVTYVWMAVVALGVLVWVERRALRRGALPVPTGALVGGLVSVAACLALWPWLYHDPFGHLARTFEHWNGRVATEYFFGVRTVGPPFTYYPVLFAVTTPALVLVAGLAGAVLGLRSARTRVATAFVVVALLAPFLQGLSPFRQDLARYVIQSWPALALLAGVATSRLGEAVASRLRASGARAAVALLPALLLFAYVGLELRSVEPFPLDYYDELTGGPGRVARLQLFDVSWWAEGGGHAVTWVNAHAPRDALVRIDTANWDVRSRLRDDLVEVAPNTDAPADYVVVNYHLYGNPPPRACALLHRVAVRGAPLASVYGCQRPTNVARGSAAAPLAR